MRLVLRTISGDERHSCVWLAPGQRLNVGRGGAADHCFPHDWHMSSVHFAVECDAAVCRIRDLQSSNGTFVNGQRITLFTLHDGDTIQAGQSTFAAEVEGESAALAPQPSPLVSLPRRESGVSSLEQITGRGSDATSPRGQDAAADFASVRRPPKDHPTTKAPGSPARAPAGPLIQRFVLNSDSGSVGSQRCWLQPGQTLSVGRTDDAELATADPEMEAVHFTIHCGASVCCIRDLTTGNGTFVNGALVAEALLRHGDRITAGQTKFIVDIECAPGSEAAPVESHPSFTKTRSPAGVYSYIGLDSRPSPLETVRLLATKAPLSVIVDPVKFPVRLPLGPNYLLDSLSPALAQRLSPIFISASDGVDLLSLVEQAWGKDALVCIFSNLDAPQLLAELREAARGEHTMTAASEHILRSCRPSRLAPLVAASSPQFAEFLYSRIDALLIEPQSSEYWEVMARTEFGTVLEELGWIEQRPAPSNKLSLRGDLKPSRHEKEVAADHRPSATPGRPARLVACTV
ncbi:MAG: FHA domain-containing protein [Thermoguttaceae bacterium]